jgi:hypothetical protein
MVYVNRQANPFSVGTTAVPQKVNRRMELAS